MYLKVRFDWLIFIEINKEMRFSKMLIYIFYFKRRKWLWEKIYFINEGRCVPYKHLSIYLSITLAI